MTPKTRKETYLAKAAGDDVSIPEPITREEVYLNRIAENGGGGGGDGIQTFLLENYQGIQCKITGTIKAGDVFVIKTESCGLCVVRKNGDYYPVAVINDAGYVRTFFLKNIAENEYCFYTSNTPSSEPVNPLLVTQPYEIDEQHERYLRMPEDVIGLRSGYVATYIEENGHAVVKWQKKDTVELLSITGALDQIISVIKPLAENQPNTAITKYLTLTGQMSVAVAGLNYSLNIALQDKAIPIIEIDDSVWIFDGGDYSSNDIMNMYSSIKFKEIDFSNNKIYSYLVVLRSDKAFIQCTCYEATSLM